MIPGLEETVLTVLALRTTNEVEDADVCLWRLGALARNTLHLTDFAITVRKWFGPYTAYSFLRNTHRISFKDSKTAVEKHMTVWYLIVELDRSLVNCLAKWDAKVLQEEVASLLVFLSCHHVGEDRSFEIASDGNSRGSVLLYWHWRLSDNGSMSTARCARFACARLGSHKCAL